VRIGPLIAALAYAGAACLFGLALGERGELGLVQTVFGIVIPMATYVLALMAKPPRRPNVLLTGLAMFAGLAVGVRHFERAWDECVTRGPLVRAAIVRYHDDLDAYPSRLEELPIELPCKCGLRPTILHYISNERTFRLWMTNEEEVVDFSSSSGKSSAPLPR
jgi:hypothetical protein